MKILRIDHVALLFPEVTAPLELFRSLFGLVPGPREYVETQLTEAAFLLTPAEGEACLEFIAPKPRGENVGLEKFLEKSQGRGGLHHIAFLVEDLESALDELFAQGIPLIDRKPRKGARGHNVAFLHPRALGGILVELVSAEKHP